MRQFDREWDRMRSAEARVRDIHTPGPWVAQGPLIHGPDKGGMDIGPLIGEMETDADARYIVQLVNERWRA